MNITLFFVKLLVDGETGKPGVHVLTRAVAVGSSDRGSVTILFLPPGVSLVWVSLSLNLSLVVRKPVFGVSDQAPTKPSCTATGDG